MKKEKIYNIIIAALCFLLWFLPTEKARTLNKWNATIQYFFALLFSGQLFEIWTLRELLIILLGGATIILLIVHIIKDTKITKLLMTIGVGAYMILWIFAILVPFPNRSSILFELSSGANVLLLILYFAMLIAIIVLTILQYHFLSRRPTKTERLQAQIDDMQKQIDELKKGE